MLYELIKPKFTVIVEQYLFGQFRIKLTDPTVPSEGAPGGHGEIFREADTYKKETLDKVLKQLENSEDGESVLKQYEDEYSTHYPGDRIRLDSFGVKPDHLK